jgi:acyl-CoA synthetase (AMP-forming)/AMP-acid ligase II
MTPAAAPHWDKTIAVEEIGGVPFRLYTNRPRRIERLLPFAAAWGDRAYVIQGDRAVGFDGLLRASAAKAAQLTEHGVREGDRVLLLGWNSPEWVVNFWACLRIGAVPALANAWWSAGEIADAVERLQPKVSLADAPGLAKLPAFAAQIPWKTPVGAAVDPNVTFETSSDENAPAAIIFTSGTEGRAKAVVLSHRSLIAVQQMLLHVTRRLPFTPSADYGEVTLHTGPLFHIGGIGALIRGVLLGNTLLFPTGRFDPGEAIELIARYRITRWNAVPTMATRLIEQPDIAKRDISCLKTLTLGGAPVHAELLHRIHARLPGLTARIASGYGLSENAGQATAAGGAETADRPGSSGRPLPLVEVKILARSGLQDGEVLIRSPTQMLGYFGDDTSPIDPEGWLHTGDLGRIDDQGSLWITGRSKDLIIRGGENVAPAAVERALIELPGVVDAAVIGVPHADLGEEVAAFVVVSGDQTLEALQAGLRESIASFAVPSIWRLQSEPLPVNQTGKVDKASLLARVGACNRCIPEVGAGRDDDG